MNRTPLRQLFLASVALAAVNCAPADGAATSDVPEEAQSAAIAQEYGSDASDCWGEIRYCPGTTMVESCTLNSGAASDGASGAAHRVSTYEHINSSWHWTQCANGSTIQMQCQGPGRQTLASCMTEFGTGASYGVVGTRGVYTEVQNTWTRSVRQVNGAEGVAEYYSSGFLKSYFPNTNLVELSAQGLPLRCAARAVLELDEDSYVTYCTLAPDSAWGQFPRGVTVTQGGGSFFCPANAVIEFGPNGFVKRCNASIDFNARGTASLGAHEFDDNGFLIASSSRLATPATLTTRSGAVNCAANSAVTFDTDGYLRTCNITAGQTESFPAQGQSPVNVACQGTFSLDTAGRVGYCSALAGDRALRPPPLGTTQQPSVTCKDARPSTSPPTAS